MASWDFWDRLKDFGKDIVDFERTNLREMGRKLKEDPERAFIGAGSPLTSEIWGGVLGKDYEPMLDNWGGPADSTWQRAQDEGVDLGPNRLMHGIAHSVAQMYAMNYAGGQIQAFGASQGWNPAYVDMGIDLAEKGLKAELASEDYSGGTYNKPGSEDEQTGQKKDQQPGAPPTFDDGNGGGFQFSFGQQQQPQPPPPVPPQTFDKPTVTDTFGAQLMPKIQTASGAPGAAQVPGARQTFFAPTPTPPKQPGKRMRRR